MDRMRHIEQRWLKPNVPAFRVGNTVDVHVRIVEEVMEAEAAGAKKQAGKKKAAEKRERIQVFSGVVIADKHESLRRTITVRRIVQGEGVERIFPLHSPVVAKIDVKREGKVRRAKLYYLRNLAGRKARLVEKRSARQFADLVGKTPEGETPVAAKPAAPVPAAPQGASAAAGTPA